MENTSEAPAPLEEEDTTIRAIDLGMFFIALSLALFILAANLSTILAIWLTPGLRTMANSYVCSLACADLVVGAVCVLLAIYLLPPFRVGWFDKYEVMCSLLNGLNIGMTVVSAFSMTLIAVDRYIYITKPYFYQRKINFRVIGVSVTSVWLAGLVVAFLPQFIATYHPQCHITGRLPVWYLFYLCTFCYILTCAVNIALYSIILQVAHKQRKAVVAIRASVQTPEPGDGSRANSRGPKQIISKGSMKSIKFFLTVFGCFFCCITPMVLILALDIYVPVPAPIYRLFNVLALINSAMNFLIYAGMNAQFRRAIVRTSPLCRGCAWIFCHSRMKNSGVEVETTTAW
ncbi:hypothetical protein EGW08_005372 [Elysia chlorotica]|uniref:G-protein coupled receptors family 1 profile domain-containing protein n=1 Tax=Elysia chlorotica TaxID=188477 RepID=A0A433TZ79_ELYCH|nr:hypothetical protein EGW08_005372 [Elysia chlorotica]